MKRSMIYFIILSFFTSSIPAQNSLKKSLDDPALTLYRRIPDGICKTVFVVDTFMYMGNGAAVDIYGISDPANPHKLGRLVTPAVVKKIFVKDKLAFIAEMKHGIFIADVTNPAEPELVGSYKYYNSSHLNGLAEDVFAKGDYAYIAYGEEGLRVIDVSVPSNPTDVGVILNDNKNLTYAYAVDVVGNYAYVANGGYGMNVIDVSNPDSMKQVGAFENSGVYPSINDICVVDTIAYLSSDWRGLTVVNISDPTNPVETDSYSPGDITISVFAEGDYAYITQAPAYGASDTTVGLTVLNVSDPYNITDAGEYITEGYPYSVFAKDSLIFIADGGMVEVLSRTSSALKKNIPVSNNTLRKLDESLKIFKEISGLGDLQFVSYSEQDYGIYASKNKILFTFDYSDNEEYEIMDELKLEGTLLNIKTVNVTIEKDKDTYEYYTYLHIITTKGYFLYQTTENDQGIVVKLIRKATDLEETLKCMEVDNQKIAICSDDKLHVQDNTDPTNTNPNEGTIDIEKKPADVCFDENNNIYVLEQIPFGGALLEVFNATDINNLTKVSSVNLSANSYLEAMDFSFPLIVFVGSDPIQANKEYVGIIDVSNPAEPQFISERSFEGGGKDVEFLDSPEECCVAEGENGISLFDLSDPTNIKKTENHPTGGEAKCVYVSSIEPSPPWSNTKRTAKTYSDSALYIFVADGGDGAYIYKYETTTKVKGTNNQPIKFELFPNYPNPFPVDARSSTPTTTIKYSIPAVGTAHELSLQTRLIVYDILGRKVATLVNKTQAPGNYSVQFNAENLPSGIYFYTLQAGSFVKTRKMILLK